MMSQLRSLRFWVIIIVGLPLLLGAILVVVLIASPAHRIRHLVPFLVGLNPYLPTDGQSHLRDWIGDAAATKAGFAATIDLLKTPDPRLRSAITGLANRGRFTSADWAGISTLDETRLVMIRATLHDPDPRTAGWAIRLLADLGDITSLDAVLARHRDTRLPPVTNEVLYYLGHLAPETMEVLAEQLAGDAVADRWLTACWAYERFPSTRSLTTLVAWARSDDPFRSARAVMALMQASQNIVYGDRRSSPSRVDAAAHLRMLREVITDRTRDLVLRQRLLICVLDQTAAYHLCQDLLRETRDHRRTAELVVHALHCLEPRWGPRLQLIYQKNTGWMEESAEWMDEHWPIFASPAPDDPPPPDEVVLMAVREAILRSERNVAGAAIVQALRPHLAPLAGRDRGFLAHIIEEIEHGTLSFNF